jgi:hypothetical protein
MSRPAGQTGEPYEFPVERGKVRESGRQWAPGRR